MSNESSPRSLTEEQEKVQREGIRLQDEPDYMTYPVAIECRKKLAYSEKMARESQDPDEIQRCQNLAEWGNLIQKQIMYASNGERERIGPVAARAREKEEEAKEDNADDENAPGKKRYKGKKCIQKTQASDPYPVDVSFDS
ncbi:hypothetical protein NCS52_00180200 [Fusarium sp. LHS14.1]|nr:hypothetical protein NCS52_00180200 [Fusarium sp. LHS14.1]